MRNRATRTKQLEPENHSFPSYLLYETIGFSVWRRRTEQLSPYLSGEICWIICYPFSSSFFHRTSTSKEIGQDGDRTNQCCFWKIWSIKFACSHCNFPTFTARTGRRSWQQCSNKKGGLARWRPCGRVTGAPSPMCLGTPGRAACIAIFVWLSTCSWSFRSGCGLWPSLCLSWSWRSRCQLQIGRKRCKYKNRCKYKTQKKHLKKTRQYFSNADSLLLVHNSPSCVFKRFYAGENKPRRAQFSNLTQSAPGLQKDISKER